MKKVHSIEKNRIKNRFERMKFIGKFIIKKCGKFTIKKKKFIF